MSYDIDIRVPTGRPGELVMDPPNGWGDTEGAQRTLEWIAEKLGGRTMATIYADW